jgi:hypothetical protein
MRYGDEGLCEQTRHFVEDESSRLRSSDSGVNWLYMTCLSMLHKLMYGSDAMMLLSHAAAHELPNFDKR